MTRCRSCGAEVIWAYTSTGRLMPVDPEPSPSGNLDLVFGPNAVAVIVVPDEKRVDRINLRTSHFATCPDAVSWRK